MLLQANLVVHPSLNDFMSAFWAVLSFLLSITTTTTRVLCKLFMWLLYLALFALPILCCLLITIILLYKGTVLNSSMLGSTCNVRGMRYAISLLGHANLCTNNDRVLWKPEQVIAEDLFNTNAMQELIEVLLDVVEIPYILREIDSNYIIKVQYELEKSNANAKSTLLYPDALMASITRAVQQTAAGIKSGKRFTELASNSIRYSGYLMHNTAKNLAMSSDSEIWKLVRDHVPVLAKLSTMQALLEGLRVSSARLRLGLVNVLSIGEKTSSNIQAAENTLIYFNSILTDELTEFKRKCELPFYRSKLLVCSLNKLQTDQQQITTVFQNTDHVKEQMLLAIRYLYDITDTLNQTETRLRKVSVYDQLSWTIAEINLAVRLIEVNCDVYYEHKVRRLGSNTVVDRTPCFKPRQCGIRKSVRRYR